MNHLAALAFVPLFLAATPGAMAYAGENLSKAAQVTMKQASRIALTARPGKITDRELEREKGGSGLRYSFDVSSKGATYEVGVDARTGSVLENSTEGAHPRLTGATKAVPGKV